MLPSRSRSALFGAVVAIACGGESSSVYIITADMCIQGGGQLASAECPSRTQPLPAEVDDGRQCCKGVPFTNAECRGIGGMLVADPGNGSVTRSGCPNDELELGGLAETVEGGWCCVAQP